MLDEDIEYIGTRLAFPDDSLPPPQIASGIILRVDKSTEDPACVLTFRRAVSSVVHIGRRPSNEDRSTDGAMFRCAVVSRKHAKIAFSDSGHVYLIDMNSHHGTHIRKPNEPVSHMLKPETPTKLADGDVLTFGKSVGRHTEFVRPVVARVEIIYAPRPVKQIDLTSPPPRSTSGRYGVFDPFSGNNSSAVSEDSDVEEISSIPASGPNALPLPPRVPRNPEPEPTPFGRAIEVLKRLLPPAHIPGAAPPPPSQPRPAVYTPPNDSDVVLDTSDQYDHNRLHSPIYSPSSPDWPRSPWLPDPRSPGESNRSLSPLYEPSYSEPAAPRDNGFEDRSRSTSPMDLASPSPPMPVRSLSPEQPAQDEPNVIGAWPASRSSSPHPESAQPILLNITQTPAGTSTPPPPPMQKAMSLNSICSEPFPHPNNEYEFEVPPVKDLVPVVLQEELDNQEDSFIYTSDDPVEVTVPSASSSSKKSEAEVTQLQDAMKKLQDEVTKLQIHRRKYKARFNSNVHFISNKLSNFDDRISDIHAQYTMLADRIDSAVDFDIPDLQAQLEVLREKVESTSASSTTTATTTPAPPIIDLLEHPDVKSSISTLQALVSEMQALRDRTASQMASELRAVREARDAALAHIAQVQTSSISVSTPATSLKRKRSDADDADESFNDDEGENSGVANETTEGCAGDAMMANTSTSVPVSPLMAICSHRARTRRDHEHRRGHGSPPAKRARRIASVAVQTATAVTVGAIATWSALAFS